MSTGLRIDVNVHAVKAWLAERGMTAAEAARRLGFSEPLFSLKVNGKRTMTYEELAVLAEILDTHPRALATITVTAPLPDASESEVAL